MSARRIGLFGGAFDPPHHGHVALARCAVEQLKLDSLQILPTGHAWHKTRALTEATHRVAMAQLAFASVPQAVVDPQETERAGPTYTLDTLQALQAQHSGAEFFLLLGADQASSFDRWHGWQTLAENAIICVAQRGLSTLAPAGFDIKTALKERFTPLTMPTVAVSATEIRQRVAQYLAIDHLVPEPVARYIAHHGLYQSHP